MTGNALEVDDVLVATRTALLQVFGARFDDVMFDYVCESIAADVEEQGVPSNADEARLRYCDLLENYGSEIDDDEAVMFCSTLVRQLQSLQQHLMDGDDDAADVSVSDCQLCGREMPLTRHHLKPRETHAALKKKGQAQQDLNAVALICRPCHSACHSFVSNKDMAAYYHTIDRLLEVEAIRKFAAWASKQRVRHRVALPEK